MDKEKEEQQKNRKISEVSKASQEHEEEEEDEEDEDEQTSSDPVPVPVLPIHRKSSYGFDEYKFQGTVLEENETGMFIRKLHKINPDYNNVATAKIG